MAFYCCSGVLDCTLVTLLVCFGMSFGGISYCLVALGLDISTRCCGGCLVLGCILVQQWYFEEEGMTGGETFVEANDK